MTVAAPTLRSRHLLGIAELDPAEIELILETALAMKEIGTRPIKKVPTLRGRTVEAMAPDMIVIRHASSGAPHLLARVCHASIINAGDGTHEHPTQALLDALTMREHKGRLAGLRVAIIGDLMHSRVLRSNLLLLTKMGADVRACGPATLLPLGLDRLGIRTTSSIDAALDG